MESVVELMEMGAAYLESGYWSVNWVKVNPPAGPSRMITVCFFEGLKVSGPVLM